MPRDFLPRMRASPCQYCLRQHPTPPHARYFQRQQLRADYATFVRLYRVQTVWRPCGLCKNTHACFLRFSNRSPNICFPTRPPASGIAAIVEFARPRRVNNASLCCFPGRGYPRLSWPYELSCCCTSESPRHHHNPRPRPRFAGPKMWVAFAPHQTPRKKLPPAVGC